MGFNYDELIVRKKFYLSQSWKAMRKKIRQRDNNECQWCKAKGKLTIDRDELNRNGRKKNALIVHHIKELEERPDLRLNESNLVTVCFECHERHHERWKENHKPKENKWSADEMW